MRPRVFIIANNPCINWDKLGRREGDIIVCMNLYNSRPTKASKKIESCPYLMDYLWLRVCKNGNLTGDPTLEHIKQINPETKVFFHSEHSSYAVGKNGRLGDQGESHKGANFGDDNVYDEFSKHLLNKPEVSTRYEIVTKSMYPSKRPKIGPVVAYWAVGFELFNDYDIHCVNFTIPYEKVNFNIWHNHKLDDELVLKLQQRGRIKLIFT